MQYAELLKICQRDAVRRADNSYFRQREQREWMDVYEYEVVKEYINRISPISYGEVVAVPNLEEYSRA